MLAAAGDSVRAAALPAQPTGGHRGGLPRPPRRGVKGFVHYQDGIIIYEELSLA